MKCIWFNVFPFFICECTSTLKEDGSKNFSIRFLLRNFVKSSIGLEQHSRYRNSVRALRFGNRIPAVARFSTPVHTGPWTHPASYTTGTSSFPGGEVARGVALTTHPHLVPRLKKEEIYTCTIPPCVFMAVYRLSFTFTFSLTVAQSSSGSQQCLFIVPILYRNGQYLPVARTVWLYQGQKWRGLFYLAYFCLFI